ncbi:MAG: OmpA family protein [Myxococcaceae bacterium]|nr:OmpA family protein [Myxococcaceae bacterium]
MHRTLLSLGLLLASTSLAQTGDEWSSPFSQPNPPATPAKPATPPPAEPPKKTQPAPAPAPAPTVTPPPSSRLRDSEPNPADARARADERLKAATGTADPKVDPKKAAEDAKLPIVSKKETYEAGTEPHSPSSWGTSIDTPGNARVTVGNVGIGTAYVPSARLGGKGLVRVGFLGEYLNINDFPVRNAANIRSGITFGASFQPFSWGELFVGYTAAANTNNRTSPNLIQALGDLTFGLKASNEWAKGFHAGVDLRLLTFSGVGNQGIDRFAVGFRPTLLVAYDVRALSKSVPLIANLAVGFTFDSTANLVTQRLNASEEYALGINRYNRFNFGASLEIPLPIAVPFIEYSLAAPLGVPSGILTGPDGASVPAGAAMPQQLGLGVKITAIKDLTLLTGVNLGLTRNVGLGVPATPPWNFFVGASFAIDPFQRGETKTVEIVRERKIEQKVETAKARIEGTVVNKTTKAPIAGALVQIPGLLPSATDAQGKFRTLDLGEAKAKLVVSRDGFKGAEQDVALQAGKATTVEIGLEEDVKKGLFEVTTTSQKKTIKGQVTLTAEGTVVVVDTIEGAAKEIEVPAGTYTAAATADGYLSQTREVQIPAGGKMPLAFDLAPAPKKMLVIFKGDKIEILQQVHFATGKSTILADSFDLLKQVVDVIVRNNVKRVSVEGHTDNKGVKAANQKLSEDRARAVVEYLVAQGVDPKRLESVGYGDSKPIAPNLTARGRELNRRVEFIVMEK